MLFLHDEINQLIEQKLGVGQAMQKLIDAAHHRRPSDGWDVYRLLDYDAEATRLSREWFPSLLASDPPARKQIGALIFVLLQPIRKNLATADFFVGGCSHLVEDETGSGWVMNATYLPKNHFADSRVMHDIYNLAYQSCDGLGNDAEESLCLGYVGFMIRDLFAAADDALFALSDRPVDIAIGWDSGAPLHIGTASVGGFRALKATDAIANRSMQQAAFNAKFKPIGL